MNEEAAPAFALLPGTAGAGVHAEASPQAHHPTGVQSNQFSPSPMPWNTLATPTLRFCAALPRCAARCPAFLAAAGNQLPLPAPLRPWQAPSHPERSGHSKRSFMAPKHVHGVSGIVGDVIDIDPSSGITLSIEYGDHKVHDGVSLTPHQVSNDGERSKEPA
jgi:hypothetical protein